MTRLRKDGTQETDESAVVLALCSHHSLAFVIVSPIPKSHPSLPKSIFNTVARRILFKPKSDYVTALIRIGQWLPACLTQHKTLPNSKVLTSFHKALHDLVLC